MDERPLNVIAIWVLLAVSEEPCHLYGLRGRIYGLSLAYVIPNPETLRSSLKMLVREGLVAEVGYEEGVHLGLTGKCIGLRIRAWGRCTTRGRA